MPLEGAVDPDSYIVGPGDKFLISAALSALSTAPIPVGADGRLPIPDARPVQIAGMTLSSARTAIMESMAATYAESEINIVLVSPRHFWVHVSGAVPSPRRYLTLPVSRVSTVLIEAFADTLRTPTTNSLLKPSLRNITVVHADGSEQSVDLLKYFGSGDLDSDPYLRDGDVIIVPAYDPAFSSVYIDGAVPFPGSYDYRPDDTIQSLIAVAGGVDQNSSIENVRVLRSDGAVQDQIFTFSLRDILLLGKGSFPLKPRDHVSIARKSTRMGTASIDGMVSHPGTYPIQDGVTTLMHLIEMAGGLHNDALLRGAHLERSSMPVFRSRSMRETALTRATPVPKFLPPDSTEILLRLRLTDLDYLSRAYFAQETRLQNRVSLDLEKIVRGDSAPIFLQDGDHLFVPRDEKTVYVFGQVLRAGFVSFVEGRNAGYYIAQAGGRGYGAADTEPYIILAGTGAVNRLTSHIIQSGDMIFLDRLSGIVDDPALQTLVLEKERSRSDARIRTMGVVLQTVATVASVTALIISLRK